MVWPAPCLWGAPPAIMEVVIGDLTKREGISRGLLLLLAVACGVTVGNLYYSQPLLPQMAGDLGVSDARMGSVVSLSQLGYALGLLLLVPLGDRMDRSRLIFLTAAASVPVLLLFALAPSASLLLPLSLLLGFVTVTPQIIVPYAAGLAGAEGRGRVIGTVMSGLFVGIVVARVVSGFLGQLLGWRLVYVLAAVATALLLPLLRGLPRSVSGVGHSYGRLLRSLWHLLREEPVLRQSCFLGATTFACYSILWATLAFYLEGPSHGYGSAVTGLFGLTGLAGALTSLVVGRVADARGPLRTIAAGLLLLAFAYLCLLGGTLLPLLALGACLLDAGTQSVHISNQTRVLGLSAEARNRLNTAYMVTYFAGGALGSYLGVAAWNAAGWPGVCLAGLGVVLLGGLGYATFVLRRSPYR